QGRQHPGFGQVGLNVGRGRDAMAVRHLDGHVALKVVVMRLVDNAEGAGPESGRDPVAPQASGQRTFLAAGLTGFGRVPRFFSEDGPDQSVVFRKAVSVVFRAYRFTGAAAAG